MTLPLMAAVHSTSSQVRPPPLTQSDAVTSLLSLGLAAAADGGSTPIPVRHTTSTSSTDSAVSGVSFQTSPSTSLDNRALNTGLSSSTVAASTTGKHHRRLGSTGKTRRRLSDAREASARPFPQHSLLSLASLSLSTSPGALSSKPLAPRPQSGSNPSGILIAASDASPAQVSLASSPVFETTVSTTLHGESEKDVDKTTTEGSTPIPISTNGKQKKRGVDYKCESCAKIYRHPNCLNKHRWEHTRQWREASKFVLSKHQQVQLLEAAAILSFMGTNSTSLPEDRSEWPSFLSGGSLPMVESISSGKDKDSKPASGAAVSQNSGRISSDSPTTPYALRPHPVPLSTSVPARMSAHSHGPRMHDFTLPPSSNIGVLGSGSAAAAAQAQQWRPAPGPSVGVHTPTNGHTESMNATMPFVHLSNPSAQIIGAGTMLGDGSIHQSSGWTSHIPSSSVRSESSVSAGSGSRSRSGSRSNSRSDGSELEPDMEDEDVDVEVMDADTAEDDEREKLVARDMTKKKMYGAVPVPVQPPRSSMAYNNNITVGTHPYGSYGSYRRSGYGSYGSSGTATAGSLGSHSGYSSHGDFNTNGTAGTVVVGYGSYGHRRNSFSSRARRGSIGMNGLKTEEDDDIGVAVKEEDEDEDQDLERKWNGMEMEVDMDMD